MSTARRRARILWAVAVIAVIAFATYASSTSILIGIGDQLIHADPLERADSILVLASGLDRIVEASELYRAGYAPVVVLTREAADPSEEFLRGLGITVESREDRRRRVLQALGVPAASIVTLDDIIASTMDEARVFARWAHERSIASVIIVTSPDHSARARLTFLRAFERRPVKVLMRPSKLGRFRSDTWWHSRTTLREGLVEWQKLVYYRLVELHR